MTATPVNDVPAMSLASSTPPRMDERRALNEFHSYSDYVNWLQDCNRVRPAHSSLEATSPCRVEDMSTLMNSLLWYTLFEDQTDLMEDPDKKSES